MKRRIYSDQAPSPIGPYTQGIACKGELVFVSGQLPMNTSGQIVGTNITDQTEQAMKNIGFILEAAGCGWADLVKCTVLLKDMADFAAMNAVYQNYVLQEYPARMAYQVAKLPLDCLVEIDAIAVVPGT